MFNRFLNHLEEWLITFLIGAATLVIFFAVVHRFVSTVPYIQDYAVKLNVMFCTALKPNMRITRRTEVTVRLVPEP